jgi:hypothetical protein
VRARAYYLAYRGWIEYRLVAFEDPGGWRGFERPRDPFFAPILKKRDARLNRVEVNRLDGCLERVRLWLAHILGHDGDGAAGVGAAGVGAAGVGGGAGGGGCIGGGCGGGRCGGGRCGGGGSFLVADEVGQQEPNPRLPRLCIGIERWA